MQALLCTVHAACCSLTVYRHDAGLHSTHLVQARAMSGPELAAIYVLVSAILHQDTAFSMCVSYRLQTLTVWCMQLQVCQIRQVGVL